MPRDRAQTRETILKAAYVLFRRSGFTRVSMDEIAEASALTKRTLYAHFRSKDDLLTAVLEDQHGMAYEAFQTFGQKLKGTPEEIVKAFFADLAAWAAQPRWPGSGFTRLAMELADLPGHPARKIASRHKGQLEQHLAELLGRAGVPNAERMARQIWILSEGAIALIFIRGDRSYAKAAEEAALAIVAQNAQESGRAQRPSRKRI
jgi:AcrR family transcriptional regulator